MDKYEKAARELLGKQCPLIVFGWFASAFRWYHETYLQPAIDAAVKEALEKRDGEIQGGEMKEAKFILMAWIIAALALLGYIAFICWEIWKRVMHYAG